jgi:cytochrome c
MKWALMVSAAILAASISQAGDAKSAESCRLLIGPNVMIGNAKAGERLFLRCQACHTVNLNGPNLVGPNLGRIFTGKSLTSPGYRYSAAFTAASPKWTDFAMLDSFLRKPSEVVPGTKMIFAGLPKAQDRADLISYLTKATDRRCSAK